MSCRGVLLIALASTAACDVGVDPAILIRLDGQATVIMDLTPPVEPVSARQGTFRWLTIEGPEGSVIPQPEPVRIEEDKVATFQPDLRGTYLIERWLTYGVGEDLTHRFVLDVAGVKPLAGATTETPSVTVSTSASLSGATSTSPEHRELTYQWRLVERPLESMATIAAEGVVVSFIPDVAGNYLVGLSVFDGELWSDNPVIVPITATE